MFKRESQRDRALTPWMAMREEFKVEIEESGGGLVFFLVGGAACLLGLHR